MPGQRLTTRRWIKTTGAAIHDGWERSVKVEAARKVPLQPYNKPNGYLKREVYRFVRDCRERRSIDILQELVAGEEAARRPTAYNDQEPFYWGFMYVCGMDERVSRQDRWRFANQLTYADKHDVPPELLVGFIYQIGRSDGLRQKLLHGHMEEWWISPKS